MHKDSADRRFDAVVVGGGHNGLTAAAYLAKAGKSVLVLERADHVGGASVSAQVFPGVDARLSRYSYLVSLMPETVRRELGLQITLRRRRFSSFTPDPVDPSRALLIDTADPRATIASFEEVGARTDAEAWTAFYGRTGALAKRLFPTVTEPLRGPDEARAVFGEDDWRDFVERPIGEVVQRTFSSDLVRGVVLTDSLIGTFARPDADDGLANRCFLYHVIGGGTGDWDVPVGGMGSVIGELQRAARSAGAEVRTRARVTEVDPGSRTSDATVAWVDDDGTQHEVSTGHVLAACAPAILDGLLGREPRWPEGAQLKVNMLLNRLPRLRAGADPAAAFAGTFHINETATQLETAFTEASAGAIPSLPPAEIYCHTLTDPSILGGSLRDSGAHTLTLFALHQPARLFRDDPEAAREVALAATLASLDSVLDEPIGDCIATAHDGSPCIEARSPVDLEDELAMPGGHIFHGDLSWPWAESSEDAGSWGVATEFPRVLIAGAGARRGGGVSGIAGRDAAMAVLA